MAELHPPDAQMNGGGGAMVVASTDHVGTTKRQRRPSVRLGDIGDQQTYDSHVNRRTKQQWKVPPSKDFNGNKGSKTRPLMNLTDYHETLDGTEDKEANNTNINTSNSNLDGGVVIGSWKVRDLSKSKRGLTTTKRVRSNWISKVDEGADGEEKFSGGEDVDDVYTRDFDREEGSDSQLKETQSPIHSLDNDNIGHRRDVRVRVSDHGVELDGPSDTDARNWNNLERNGVRVWLNQLGLGRYAPVFEIHEVDDEVLPLLTLEDLKDMGINAVGSRRKMFCSIQKLNKGFS